MFRRVAIVAGSTTSVGVGTSMFLYKRHVAAGAPKQPVVDGPAFNALQDQNELREVLKSKESIIGSRPRVYALSSCPYCNKVKTLLEVNGVPYDTVQVDPFNAVELKGSPYRYLPQLQFRTHPDGGAIVPAAAQGIELLKEGPMIVDSDIIVESLAAPLQFASDLKNPAFTDIRKQIAEEGSRSVFALMNGSLPLAWESYPLLSDSRYGAAPYRGLGSTALWILAKWKIAPRLLPKKPDEALEALVKTFQAQAKGPFYGGASPNIVDIEMYGAIRCGLQHSAVSTVLNKSGCGQWLTSMNERCAVAKK